MSNDRAPDYVSPTGKVYRFGDPLHVYCCYYTDADAARYYLAVDKSDARAQAAVEFHTQPGEVTARYCLSRAGPAVFRGWCPNPRQAAKA